jgi:hypothetical protein
MVFWVSQEDFERRKQLQLERSTPASVPESASASVPGVASASVPGVAVVSTTTSDSRLQEELADTPIRHNRSTEVRICPRVWSGCCSDVLRVCVTLAQLVWSGCRAAATHHPHQGVPASHHISVTYDKVVLSCVLLFGCSCGLVYKYFVR